MSYLSRIANVFRQGRVNGEIDEEIESHIEEAIEQGRDPEEARRAFGQTLRKREESRDIRLVSWLDAVRSDVIFGWRQLWKSRITSGAAILSLALTMGACISAFRLADAVFFRPLPVRDPARLRTLEYEYVDDQTGERQQSDTFQYPLFRQMRPAVAGDAELMAISFPGRIDLTYGTVQETVKAFRQYCSGWTLGSFGL